MRPQCHPTERIEVQEQLVLTDTCLVHRHQNCSNTDLNRLFVVCVVVDGVESDSKLVKRLTAIDQGAGHHWHGLRPDIHTSASGAKSGKDNNNNNINDQEPHGKKIHVLFSKTKQGTAASRSDAVDFISLLSKKHERAGIKSPEEDLILLIMQAGAELSSTKWLSPVTSALIVPPPLLSGVYDPPVAFKIANAVSFGVEQGGENKAVAFDYSLQPLWVNPSAKDMALSNGDSYPTPALAGLATAMRLATYQQLPAQDLSLTDDWAANLELALNLWLCADGIDIIKDVTVKMPSSTTSSDMFKMVMLEPKDAARFAAAWMDLKYANRVFNATKTTRPQLTQLAWDTMLAQAKGRPDFPAGLQNKCRSFDWYVTEVHTELNMDDEITDPKGLPSKVVPPEKKVEEPKHKVEVKLPDAPLQIPKVEEEGQVQLPPPPDEGKKEADQKKVGNEIKKPSKPLDPERLAIIQKAHQIDTTFADVSLGNANFPHKGARDEHGNWGYVHDETALRMNPPKFEYPGLKDACEKRDNTYKMLTEQVFVDFKANEEAEKRGVLRAKIFCLVYTIDSGHDRIPFIRETWGYVYQWYVDFFLGSVV